MSTTIENRRLITDMNVAEHFTECLATALRHQELEAEDETVIYIVNLLAYFERAERLFQPTEGAAGLPTLALIYARALESETVGTRKANLKRLADLALFIAGLFSASLAHKLVDIDYYIAMGATSYGILAQSPSGSANGRVFGAVFGELSRNFRAFVDVLAEVSEESNLCGRADIMRFYEIWLKTGSPRAASKLRELGIEPLQASVYFRQ